MRRNRKPSPQMQMLLETLTSGGRQWRYGYELMKATGIRSGTLYPLLMRMTQQGLIEAQWQQPAQPGRPPRHAYRLTGAGVVFAANTDVSKSAESGSRILA